MKSLIEISFIQLVYASCTLILQFIEGVLGTVQLYVPAVVL